MCFVWNENSFSKLICPMGPKGSQLQARWDLTTWDSNLTTNWIRNLNRGWSPIWVPAFDLSKPHLFIHSAFPLLHSNLWTQQFSNQSFLENAHQTKVSFTTNIQQTGTFLSTYDQHLILWVYIFVSKQLLGESEPLVALKLWSDLPADYSVK